MCEFFCEFFIGDIVSWDGRTILLRDSRTNTIRQVMLHDSDNLAKLIGRKRKHVWIGIEDETLTDVQWIRKSGRRVTLGYFSQAHRWFNYI